MPTLTLEKIEWRLRLITPDWQGFSNDPEDWMDAMSSSRDRSNYYVYVYLDPRHCGTYDCLGWKFKNKPFYVGKGTHNRINDKKNQYTERVIRKIKEAGLEVRRLKVAKGLTEAEAYFLERNLVSLLGRSSLTNLTDGGEGAAGYTWTDEQRLKKSEQTRSFYMSLSDSEKAEYYTARFANLDRAANAKKHSKTWAEMDEKKKKSIIKKRGAAIRNWWSSPEGVAERRRRSVLQAERNRQRAKLCH